VTIAHNREGEWFRHFSFCRCTGCLIDNLTVCLNVYLLYKAVPHLSWNILLDLWQHRLPLFRSSTPLKSVSENTHSCVSILLLASVFRQHVTTVSGEPWEIVCITWLRQNILVECPAHSEWITLN